MNAFPKLTLLAIDFLAFFAAGGDALASVLRAVLLAGGAGFAGEAADFREFRFPETGFSGVSGSGSALIAAALEDFLAGDFFEDAAFSDSALAPRLLVLFTGSGSGSG